VGARNFLLRNGFEISGEYSVKAGTRQMCCKAGLFGLPGETFIAGFAI